MQVTQLLQITAAIGVRGYAFRIVASKKNAASIGSGQEIYGAQGETKDGPKLSPVRWTHCASERVTRTRSIRIIKSNFQPNILNLYESGEL
jgi:hypothetical protein